MGKWNRSRSTSQQLGEQFVTKYQSSNVDIVIDKTPLTSGVVFSYITCVIDLRYYDLLLKRTRSFSYTKLDIYGLIFKKTVVL